MAMTDLAGRPGRLLAVRLLIGLSQGLALYLLWRFRESLPAAPLRALTLVALLAPVAALGAVGALRARPLALWLTGVVLVLAGLGAYDGYVHGSEPALLRDPWPRPELFVFAAAALFIAHHLVLPAVAKRRWIAAYSSYFDEGWKDGVRLALGVAFVGALWLLLWLGAGLFKLIGLKFLETLIEQPWFAAPATTVFFAAAIHVTDIRASLVLGARTLALNLLAWLMPLMALIAGGFLVALAFTGLGPLWQTGRAGGMLLAAAAALVVLINATYQDGAREGYPPAVLKWSVRLAAVVLAPLVAVAAYGLVLRIGQHGLTPGRIYALACLAVAVVYAAGYAWAALSRGPWMRRLEGVNVVAAHLAILVILAVFSPLADPARLAAADQLARLQRGAVAPENLDYGFLRFDAGRWGQAALRTLAADPRPAVRERAADALLQTNRWDRTPKMPVVRRNAFALLGAAALPADFLAQSWPLGEDPASGCSEACPALVRDMDGDGAEEIVVFRGSDPRVYRRTAQGWRGVGGLAGSWCPSDVEALRAGRYEVRPPRGSAIIVNGREYVVAVERACPPGRAAPARPAAQ